MDRDQVVWVAPGGVEEAPQGQHCEADLEGLNGLVQEMKGVLRRLSNYLAQDQDLEARLQSLEHTTNEAEILKTLERLISEHGL